MSTTQRQDPVRVGSGEFTYEAVPDWPALPEDWSFVEVVGVATDSAGRAYAFNRGEHPVIVFEADGTFVGSWGEGKFERPHGIHISPNDEVYCTDDCGHAVYKFTTDGELVMTLGSPGVASDTGAEGIDYRPIRQGGGPFNMPTNLAIAPGGELYVSDGYGNCRVHRFAADGRLIASWGEPGDGPGEFRVPHGIAVDGTGRVYVADRENRRIQRFTAEGEFIDQWTDVVRPCEVFVDDAGIVYVAELGVRAGPFPWETPDPTGMGGRVSIFSAQGELQARWGGGENPCAPGDFFAPHDIWVDTRGDLYVGEVTMSGGGYKGVVPADCHTVQKFARVP